MISSPVEQQIHLSHEAAVDYYSLYPSQYIVSETITPPAYVSLITCFIHADNNYSFVMPSTLYYSYTTLHQ